MINSTFRVAALALIAAIAMFAAAHHPDANFTVLVWLSALFLLIAVVLWTRDVIRLWRHRRDQAEPERWLESRIKRRRRGPTE